MSKSIFKQDLNQNIFFIRLMLLASFILSLILLFWILTEAVCQSTGQELTAKVEKLGSRRSKTIDYSYTLHGITYTDSGKLFSQIDYAPGDRLLIRRIDILPEIFGTEETCIKDSVTRVVIFCVWLLLSVAWGIFYESNRRSIKSQEFSN